MEFHVIKSLIISDKYKRLIIGLIIAVYAKPLKPKALSRRARGRTGRSPVPSCLIQQKQKEREAMLFRLNAERYCKAVE